MTTFPATPPTLNAPSLFTSESVCQGHPDKVADQISDAVLDSLLERDHEARGAIETLVADDWVAVVGEWRSDGLRELRVEELVRRVLAEIGYTSRELGIDATHSRVSARLVQQSPDISRGVDHGGAGDQGMMFGYATSETPELMPLPIQLAHGLMRELDRARRDGRLPWLRPDGKGQVTVEYRNGRPTAVRALVLSAQHDPGVSQREVREALEAEVIRRTIPSRLLDENAPCHVNPTGRFEIGGPAGDSGLTGRKIMVDTYGGMARHGGGSFSGKDPTKVDRSAAYAARWAAKNVVAAGFAERCEIQLAYAIGVARPVAVRVDVFGTARPDLDEAAISRAVAEVFDFTPSGIIDALELRRPIYSPTASYGHFGRSPGFETALRPDSGGRLFPWEATDRIDDLKAAIG